MKKTVLILSLLLITTWTIPSILSAGTQDDAIAFYDQFYRQAVRDLRFGNSNEKIDASIKMGAHKKTSFVRPLGEELNHNLANRELRRTPINDPYVKSHIAWAIGHIGHRWGIPYLLTALDTTLEIINQDQARIETLEEKNRALGSPGYVGKMTKPGPFLMEPMDKDIYPASPDIAWNIADRFKSIPAIDLKEEDHYILYQGYNSINLARSILSAIGNIGRENILYYQGLSLQKPDEEQLDKMYDAIAIAIDHPLPGVRNGAAEALEGLGTKRAVSMLAERFDKETDPAVKVRMARGVLMNDKSEYRLYSHLLKELTSQVFEIRREAVIALYEIQMGESVFALRDALEVEADPTLREILKQAIFRAEVDNQVPLNY